MFLGIFMRWLLKLIITLQQIEDHKVFKEVKDYKVLVMPNCKVLKGCKADKEHKAYRVCKVYKAHRELKVRKVFRA